MADRADERRRVHCIQLRCEWATKTEWLEVVVSPVKVVKRVERVERAQAPRRQEVAGNARGLQDVK